MTVNNMVRTPLLMLGMCEAILLYSSVYIAGLIIFGSLEKCEALIGPLLPKAALVSIIAMASLVAMGLYHFHQRAYFKEIFARIVVAVAISAMALSALFYLIPALHLPVRMALAAGFTSLAMLLAGRFLFLQVVDENIFRRRTLVYGAGERAAALQDLRRRADRRGFKIVGSVLAPGDTCTVEPKKLIDRKEKPLLMIAGDLDADEIVIAMDDRRGNLPVRELLACKLRGIEVLDLVEFLERESGKIRIDLVNPGWLIFSPGFRVGTFGRIVKRVVDLALSILALLLAWPLLLIIAIAIKIEDGIRAPVFYKQERVGHHGNYFMLMKFRSMCEDAEKEGEPVWALEDDDRVTRVGGFLRKYRLDELPQIFNVLRGDMSLVGPRPERPKFVDELSQTIPYYAERHTVKPGVTGWAQLRYSYGASEDDAAEKLQYDLYYVKNESLLLDLMIILQTVEVVLWGKGAR